MKKLNWLAALIIGMGFFTFEEPARSADRGVELAIHLPVNSTLNLKASAELKPEEYFTKIGESELSAGWGPHPYNSDPSTPQVYIQMRVECYFLHKASTSLREIDAAKTFNVVAARTREAVSSDLAWASPWSKYRNANDGGDPNFLDIYLKTAGKSRLVVECALIRKLTPPTGVPFPAYWAEERKMRGVEATLLTQLAPLFTIKVAPGEQIP